MQIGREPTPPPEWPDIYHVLRLVDAVATWLQEHEGAQRRPEVTARILVLVVLWDRTGEPWPTRPQVCDYLDVSLPMLDTVRSQRQATGHLDVVKRIVSGNIKSRASVVTHTYLVPCPELKAVVARAEKATKPGITDGNH